MAPQAAETTAPTGSNGSSRPPAARTPAARSGTDLPPGIYRIGPGTGTAGSPPAPTTDPGLVEPVPGPTNAAAEADTPTAEDTAASTAEPGHVGPASDPALGEVLDAEAEEVEAEAEQLSRPGAVDGRRLSATGDGTRRLLLFGGLALLAGAVVVSFTGRDQPRSALAAGPAGPRPRRRRPGELEGWEDGVPLAPAKRDVARRRLGITAESYSGESRFDDAL